METVPDFAKNIFAIVDQYEPEDRPKIEGYESKLLQVLNKHDIKPPPVREIKKPKFSIQPDVEMDSGVDATTSTATQSSRGSTRPSRSAKTKASQNLKLPKLGTKLRQDIKMEPISEDDPKPIVKLTTVTNENDVNTVNVKREKISVGIRSLANSSGETDSSVVVIANEVNTITLSDDDGDDEKMPPPAKPAPKKPAARNTRKATKVVQSETESNNADDDSSSSELPPKLETLSTKSTTLKTNKTRTKKAKKPLIPFVEVKQEKVDVILTDDESSQEQSSQKSTQDTNDNQISANGTLESVYEDANDKLSQPTTDRLAVCATYVCEPTSRKPVDNTFVSTNNTFNVNGKPQNDDTYSVPATKPIDADKAKISVSSLMTEDDSEDEMFQVAVPSKLKTNKELFNPCIQSPLKMKVAAFERQANELRTPNLPTRQTRTKTRQLAKENAENGVSKLPKPTTPSIEMKYQHTPIGQSILPAKLQTHNVLRTQTSASKLTNFNKPSSAQPLKIRSRDNSVEDLARTKEAILEKKRKGEERLKRAQQQREAQEKEKKERYLKLLQEKREKEEARKLLKAQKEQQELQKQLKAQEQKREKELRLKAELANAAKQERDNMLSKKILAEREHLNHMRQNKNNEIKSKYTFDMLLTDDSTDEEDKVKDSRPSPPEWSLRKNRKGNMIAQTGVDPNLIDKFFSCQPTTPDLAAIFPQIDAKYLKRNSSAVWNTPPRYSQLPKY